MTDEQIKEAAKEWIGGIAPALQTDYHRQKHAESFTAGANFGRRFGLEEAANMFCKMHPCSVPNCEGERIRALAAKDERKPKPIHFSKPGDKSVHWCKGFGLCMNFVRREQLTTNREKVTCKHCDRMLRVVGK